MRYIIYKIRFSNFLRVIPTSL